MTDPARTQAQLEVAAHCGNAAAIEILATAAPPIANDIAMWGAGWTEFGQRLLVDRPIDPHGRMWFPGNPYPAGHGLREFKFTAKLLADELQLLIELHSADYAAESDAADPEDLDGIRDWQAVGAWRNYNSCRLGGTIVRSFARGPLDPTRPFGFDLDSQPGDLLTTEYDELAFWHCYILGHDSIADHRLRFTPNAARGYELLWDCRVAMTSVGDDRLAHRMWFEHANVAPLAFEAVAGADEAEARRRLAHAVTNPEDYTLADGSSRLR